MNEINQLLLPVFTWQSGLPFLAINCLQGTVFALGGKLILFGPLGCAAVGFLVTLFLSGYDPKNDDDD